MAKGQAPAHGTVEGTGSAINVECGFTPAVVEVMNIDGDCMMRWTSDMPDANGFKTVAAGTTAQVTSNGITPYSGSEASNSAGFTIGADTDINVSAETIVWYAFGDND